MKQYVVIQRNADIISCLGVYDGYFKAVGRAYDYASLIIGNAGGEGTLTPLYGLANDGFGMEVTLHNENGYYESEICILKNDGENQLEERK